MKQLNITEDTKSESGKAEITKQVKIYMDTAEFKSKIEKIVKDKLKNNKELEDKIVDITGNVITQLYKTLWLKRTTWKNNLSNKSN